MNNYKRVAGNAAVSSRQHGKFAGDVSILQNNNN